MRDTRTREQKNVQIEKYIEMLSPLGFECAHDFRFTHIYADGDYDTSALHDDFVVAHAIEWIYERGIEEGEKRRQQKFKDLLGI